MVDEGRYFIPGRVYRFRTPIIARDLRNKNILTEGVQKSSWIHLAPYNEFMFKGCCPRYTAHLPKIGVIVRDWCEEVR